MSHPSLSIKLLPEPVRSLGFAAIGAGYMGIGTAFDNPIRIIMIQNLTDAILMFSFNGIDDTVPLPATGFLLLDVTTNSAVVNAFYIAQGTRIYVRNLGMAPTSGDVYVTTFYGGGVS